MRSLYIQGLHHDQDLLSLLPTEIYPIHQYSSQMFGIKTVPDRMSAIKVLRRPRVT